VPVLAYFGTCKSFVFKRGYQYSYLEKEFFSILLGVVGRRHGLSAWGGQARRDWGGTKGIKNHQIIWTKYA